jgi:hypothetical protein
LDDLDDDARWSDCGDSFLVADPLTAADDLLTVATPSAINLEAESLRQPSLNRSQHRQVLLMR